MKALIIRHCAFGDAVHASHLPRLLSDKGYEVDVNTNFKGYQIFAHNPFIKNIKAECLEQLPPWVIEKHWQIIGEGYDKVINLYGSIEIGLLAMETHNEYYMSSNVRRARYDGINYYDQTTITAGYPELCGKYKGEMFFTDEEHKIVNDWIALPKFENKKLVLMNISGTGPHKRMVQAREIADEILRRDDSVHIITTGSAECAEQDFAKELGDRATSIAGRFPFRQAALVAKHVDCVVGCESGLMCVAAMWNTPVVQLMTATSIEAHNKYNPNDFSLQSPVKCSPCYKGPYAYYGCPSRDGNPLCVYFEIDKVVNRIQEALNVNYVAV